MTGKQVAFLAVAVLGLTAFGPPSLRTLSACAMAAKSVGEVWIV